MSQKTRSLPAAPEKGRCRYLMSAAQQPVRIEIPVRGPQLGRARRRQRPARPLPAAAHPFPANTRLRLADSFLRQTRLPVGAIPRCPPAPSAGTATRARTSPNNSQHRFALSSSATNRAFAAGRHGSSSLSRARPSGIEGGGADVAAANCPGVRGRSRDIPSGAVARQDHGGPGGGSVLHRSGRAGP